MHLRNKRLPGFKTTCLIVGTLDILLAGSMFAKGVMRGMAEFKVPPQQLNSPHYADAMSCVFLHKSMIGVLIITIGVLAENPAKKVWAARVLVLMHCVYAFLDVQTSDKYFGNAFYLGNAFYQGPDSVSPVFINLLWEIKGD